VAEVPEKRAVRLVQLLSAPFAFYIIGFCDINRNQAIDVPGKHRCAFTSFVVSKKCERQTSLRILNLTLDARA
jgi:hypothetical protein